jgi:predicted RNase H-like HicB family nuclease
MHSPIMDTGSSTFTARILRDGEWFIAFSPEFPEGNGQGLTEEEALESLRESILLLMEDRREDARSNLGTGEKLVPLALA